MRRFEFSTGGSDKFWEVEQNGNDVTVRYGRIGTNGLTQTKSYGSPEAANKEHDKLVAEKLKKGYVVAKPPKTKEAAVALAEEQFVYCPDIVHQGCQTALGLASELMYSPRWYFWWD